MKLLHILASPRGENSRTLAVSNEFLSALNDKYKELEVKELDLFKIKLPEVALTASDAKYAAMSGGEVGDHAKKNWDEIIGFSREFLEYDYYLITCPMWNFTIPYVLKHYIDVIMQAGVLFSFSESGVEGLAKNKKMFCISSRGNDYSAGTPMHQYDFMEPYLRSIFGLTGIYDVSFIHAQPMDFAPGITKANLDKAKDEARALAANSSL